MKKKKIVTINEIKSEVHPIFGQSIGIETRKIEVDEESPSFPAPKGRVVNSKPKNKDFKTPTNRGK